MEHRWTRKTFATPRRMNGPCSKAAPAQSASRRLPASSSPTWCTSSCRTSATTSSPATASARSSRSRRSANSTPPAEAKNGFLFLTVFMMLANALMYRLLGVRVKHVSVDEEFLYVSDSRREVRVSLADVEKVGEWWFGRPHLVSVTFAKETEFGRW